jgi:dihydrolipoamide dehydrogenase
VVEKDRPGGVCLNWGCIPVKSLLHAAETVRNAAEGRRMGLTFGAPEIDFVSLYGWKGRVVDRLVRGIEYLFKANGVGLVRGEARFSAPGVVTVKTQDTELELKAGAFVIATGSRPKGLPCLPFDGQTVVDSDGALRLVELPGRLVVVGAGVVGLEFATVFSRLGCNVEVLEVCDQILPGTDSDIALALQKSMSREGIGIHLGVSVQGTGPESGMSVRYLDGDEEKTMEADKVLVAVGRVPLSDKVGLEWAGVKTERDGRIKVDAGYRTSAQNVYAIGDVIGGQLLAHKAMAEGISLAENLVTGKPWKFRAVPSCVYTDPEVAVVGLTEAEAKDQGRDVRVARVPLSAIGRSLTLGRSDGFCKMIVDSKTDRVLGVGMVAPQADALIAEAALAVELGLTAEKVGRVVHPHPTMSELLFEAAEAVHGRAVHIANR